MSRTNPWMLVLFALAAGVVTWALQVWVTSGGAHTLIPAIAFGCALIFTAVVALVLAWPVYRYNSAIRAAIKADDASHSDQQSPQWREVSRRRVDSSRATLALALAKASSMAGSIFVGVTGATVVWLLSRVVVGSSYPTALFSLISAAVLLIAGLVAESWCALPPDADESSQETVPTAG